MKCRTQTSNDIFLSATTPKATLNLVFHPKVEQKQVDITPYIHSFESFLHDKNRVLPHFLRVLSICNNKLAQITFNDYLLRHEVVQQHF